jgi:hypothetical protein
MTFTWKPFAFQIFKVCPCIQFDDMAILISEMTPPPQTLDNQAGGKLKGKGKFSISGGKFYLHMLPMSLAQQDSNVAPSWAGV